MQRQSFVRPNYGVVDYPINRRSPELWRSSIAYKALRFRRSGRLATLSYDLKASAADWDPGLGPSGGWRCPEGTQFGGYITDRWGRGCGVGVFRRLANAIGDAAGQAADTGPNRRRRSRNTRSQERRLRRIAQGRSAESDLVPSPNEISSGQSPESFEPNEPWAIEGWLNRLADMLAPPPREGRPPRRGRRRREVEDAAATAPRPAVDVPSNEPLLTPPQRTRTRTPLVDPDKIDWSEDRWNATRESYNAERDEVEREWRNRLNLNDDSAVTTEAVDDYVQQRIDANRSGGYVARLRALADAWRVMQDDLSDNEDLAERLNNLNPRRARRILADSEQSIGPEDQESTPEAIAPEPVDVPETELPEVEQPEQQDDLQEESNKPLFEDLEIDQIIQGVDPVFDEAISLVDRLNSQWDNLKNRLRRSGNQELNISRSRMLSGRLRGLVRRGKELYERADEADWDLDESLAPVYVAKKVEPIADEIDDYIDRYSHELPEDPDSIDVDEVINKADEENKEQIRQAKSFVDKEEYETVAIENFAEAVSEFPLPDASDSNAIVIDRERALYYLGRAVRVFAADPGLFPSATTQRRNEKQILANPGEDYGSYRMLPTSVQDALHALRSRRRDIAARQIRAMQKILSRFTENDRQILATEQPADNEMFIADPRIHYAHQAGRSNPGGNWSHEQNIESSERVLLKDLQKAIEDNSVSSLEEVIVKALGTLEGVTSWLDYDRRDVGVQSQEVMGWNAPDARRRLEQLEFISLMIQKVVDLGIHNANDDRPLSERDNGITGKSYENLRDEVRVRRDVLARDFEPEDLDDPRLPSERVSETDPQVNWPTVSDYTFSKLFDSERVQNNPELEERIREALNTVREVTSDLNTSTSWPQATIEQNEAIVRTLTADIDTVDSLRDNESLVWDDESASYDDRTIAAASLNRLFDIRQQTIVKRQQIIDRIAEQQQEAIDRLAQQQEMGIDGQLLSVRPGELPTGRSLDEISNQTLRAGLKQELDDYKADRLAFAETIPNRTTRQLRDVLADLIKQYMENRETGLAGATDRQIYASLIAEELEKAIEEIEVEIDKRRNDDQSFVDSDLLREQNLPDWNTAGDVINILLTLSEGVEGADEDDLGISVGEFEALEADLVFERALAEKKFGVKNFGLIRLYSKTRKQEKERLEAARSSLPSPSDESLSLLERGRAAIAREIINESLRVLALSDQDWSLPDSVDPEEDQNLDETLTALIEQTIDEAPNEAAERFLKNVLRTFEGDVRQILETPIDRVNFSEDIYDNLTELDSQISTIETMATSLGGNSYALKVEAIQHLASRSLRQKLRKLLDDNPDVLTDYTDFANRVIPAPFTPEEKQISRSRRIFADRVLPAFRSLVPQRRNRTRGQISHVDGSPKKITNPDITTAQDAIDHVRRGESLDEVPNEFWLLAVEANSSTELEDRSSVFYQADKKGGNSAETLIFLSRDDQGRAQEQGWVFKGAKVAQPRIILNDVTGVINSWMLAQMGLPVEGAGYDGTLRYPENNSASFVVLPYVGNSLPAGRQISGVGEENFDTATLLMSPQAGPEDEVSEYQRSLQAMMSRLTHLYASALLGLTDRHEGNGITIATKDGPVAIPIDLDGWMTESSLEDYTKFYFGTDPSLSQGNGADHLVVLMGRHYGRGLDAAWQMMRLFDDMVGGLDAALSVDEETFVDMALEGLSATNETDLQDAIRAARERYKALQKRVKEFKSQETRLRMLENMILNAISSTPAQGVGDLIGPDFNMLRDKLIASYLEGPTTEMPPDWADLSGKILDLREAQQRRREF